MTVTKNILSLLLLTISLAVQAQENVPEKYAELITMNGLQSKLSILAADDMEGRETGTRGQRKAAAYIASTFANIGLQKAATLSSYEQFFPLYQDSLIKTSISLDGVAWQNTMDFIFPLTQNESGSFESNRIVFAGYGISDSAYDDYEGLNVKGSIVVICLGEPKKEDKYFIAGENKASAWTFPGLSKKIALAANKGAVAVMLINPATNLFTQRVKENSIKSNLYYPSDKISNTALPYMMISHAAAQKLFGEKIYDPISRAKTNEIFLKHFIAVEKNIKGQFEKIKKRTDASNIIGIVEGTDKKEEYLFLTAHYDHLGIRDGKIYNGADDDGSGTVAVMEMAAAFARAKKEGKGPRRTVVFMAVSGEEKGLWGSEYYSDHPIYPLEKTTADLNTDMIGRIDTERTSADSLNYVYVVGHNKISSELPIINEGINAAHTGLVLDYKFDDPNDPNRIYYRSDHYNFARKGVPVLFFYDGMLKADYHKPTDDIEWINWPLFEKRARMIFYTAWEMANREKMLIRDMELAIDN
ncbi:MAG: M28 family peptidase [Sphingobacteriales bacterium]|nr:M28 family peptidase [Sphingobacteriales bacterium]